MSFLEKYRQWDREVSKFLTRHFYFSFFQIVIGVVFAYWLISFINLLNILAKNKFETASELLLINQTLNISFMLFLLLLNSFWILYILNNSNRMANSMKNVSYNTGRMSNYKKPNNKQK